MPAQIALLVGLLQMLPPGAGPTFGARRPLRVCADPNNMPFSNAREEGLENALARLVARDLDAELTYTWLPQRRGFVRNTLAAGRCDVMMEVPVGFERAATTQPYYRSTYAFVHRADRLRNLRSFDDPRLRKVRIGVQTIGDDYANSPPADALARRGLAANVVGYPVYGDYSSEAPLSPIVDAVARGDIDVALVWGPAAGWLARRERVPLMVVPVVDRDPASTAHLTFDIAMGVRRDDRELRARLDEVIARRKRDIDRLLARFRVPRI
jgi:mxaJ protein